MSLLIIGGDRVDAISKIVQKYGFLTYVHWGGRNSSATCKKEIPQKIDCVLMITDFLNHNIMYKFKNEAKKKKYSCALQ